MTQANFEDAELSYSEFGGARITLTNFSRTLAESGVYFDRARVIRTNFDGANLVGMTARDAFFSDSTFVGGYFHSGSFHDARFENSDFTGADFTEAEFDGADLRNVKGLTQGQVDNFSCILRPIKLPAGFRQPPRCPKRE